MNYKELSKSVKNQQISPVYLFTGPEQYIGHMMENADWNRISKGSGTLESDYLQ